VGAAVYVYDNRGSELYQLNMSALGLEPISVGKMGDIDGDGCDEFVVGCNDIGSSRGVVLLISGRSGVILRTGLGLLPGDKTFWHATGVGDYDGDGVEDFAAFPWWSAWRHMAVVWSGATGGVIRTFPEYAESVTATEDLDRDGVRDLVLGWDYPVIAPHIYGRVTAISGRDGTQLWKDENDWGISVSIPSWGWRSVGMGIRHGNAYPSLALLDASYSPYQTIPNAIGRVRMLNGIFTAQGPVLGEACSSGNEEPMIGIRETAAGARVTIAKGAPLPFGLDPFGMTGCQIYVGPEVAYLRQLGTSGVDRGYAAVDLPRHLSDAFGPIVQAQWLLFDPITGWYGASEKHQMRLQ
jgi:hypothetical protein